jgi:hypothetical protein
MDLPGGLDNDGLPGDDPIESRDYTKQTDK